MSLGLYICHLFEPYLSAAHVSDPNIPPKHLLMKFLMMGTGTNYFFHEKDYEEFLIRLHLSYRHFNGLESFLLQDYLFEANVGGEQIILTTEDMQEMQGLIHSPSSQRISREDWLPGAAKGWKDVTVAGIFAGVLLNSIEKKSETLNVIDGSTFTFELTDKILAEANLFAREVMKEMDLEKLRSWHNEKKNLILEVRNKYSKPFDYNKTAIPADLRQSILNNFVKYGWGTDEEFEPDAYDEELTEETVYLAWLYANDLVIEDLQGYWTVDGNFSFPFVIEEAFDCNVYDAVFHLKLDEFKDQLKAPVGATLNYEEVIELYEPLQL
jgi:hypothetical protein